MTRKCVRLLALALLPALALSSSDARAEETSALSADLSVGVMSDYMWRGFNLYDGTSIQPSATIEYDTGVGTIGGNLWMHLSAEGDRQDEKFTELDETVYYSIALDPVTIKTGFIWYTYPDSSDDIVDATEYFASLSYAGEDPVGYLNPVASFYDEFKETDSQYYELNVSHEFEVAALGDGFKLTPYVTLGFASNADDVFGDNGLVHVTEGINIPLQWGIISVTPSLNYTHKVADSTSNEFWAGLIFGYSL